MTLSFAPDVSSSTRFPNVRIGSVPARLHLLLPVVLRSTKTWSKGYHLCHAFRRNRHIPVKAPAV